MMAIGSDFRYALLLLVRSRLVLVGTLAAVLVASVAWLAGQFSPRQPDTVALDVGISMIRVVVPLLALLQIQDLLAREMERRLILSSLTYPRSRSVFLLGRYLAVIAVALILILALAVVVAAVVAWAGPGYAQSTKVNFGVPYLLTCGLIWMDAMVVVAFGVLLATVATTSHLVFLGGVGFMIIGRSASTIVALLERERDLVKGGEWYQQGLQWVQWLVPDLAALDIRPIALYGKLELLIASPLGLIAMPSGYVVLLFAIACIRFERRQFS